MRGTWLIDSAAVDDLRSAFSGDVIGPEHQSYDDTRQVWNAHIQRRLALIARYRGVADVVAAMRFGREHELLTAVRGGGHADMRFSPRKRSRTNYGDFRISWIHCFPMTPSS